MHAQRLAEFAELRRLSAEAARANQEMHMRARQESDRQLKEALEEQQRRDAEQQERDAREELQRRAQEEQQRAAAAAAEAERQRVADALRAAQQQAEAARVAAELAEKQRLAADTHLRDLLEWQRSLPAQERNPFSLSAPAYATLYEHDDYIGHSTRIPCCEPVNVEQLRATGSEVTWSGVSSLRVTAGTRIFLYSAPDCSGASHVVSSNLRSLSRSHMRHLNDAVQCVRLFRTDDSQGVVLFPHAEFQGEGQFLQAGSVYDVHALHEDNGASSVWMAEGSPFRVTLFDAPQPHGPGGAVSLVQRTDSLVPLNFNDKASSATVEHVCNPSCVQGQCVGRNVCHCQPHWIGAQCDLQVPDDSSFISCNAREYLVGESMQCTLHAKRDGQPIVTRREAFQLQMLLPALQPDQQHQPDGSSAPATHPSGIVWVIPEGHLSSQFAFTFRSAAVTPGLKSVPLLSARVNAVFRWPPHPGVLDQHALPHAQLTDLQSVPSVAVFDYPDGTSSLSCTKRRALLHERVDCTLELRKQGAPLVSLSRAFKLASSEPSCVKLGKLLAVADTANQGSAASGAPAAKKNNRVGRVLHFSYTPLRVPSSPDAKNTLAAVCGWTRDSLAVPECPSPLHLSMSHAPPAENDYFLQAKQLVFTQQFHNALPLLTRALRAQPLHVKEVLLLRFDLHLLFGKHRAAQSDLARLARLAKGQPWEAPKKKAEDAVESDASPAAAAATETLKPDKALAKRIAVKRGRLQQAESEQSRGMLAHAMSQWHVAATHFSNALELSKYSDTLHLLRAECALELREYNLLKYDCMSVLNQRPYDPRAILLLSKGYYVVLGNLPAALANLKLCMRYAPSSGDAATPTPCETTFQFYSRIADEQARIDELAAAGNWLGAALQCEQAMDLDRTGPSARQLLYRQCGYYSRANSTSLHSKTVSVCSDALRTLKDEMKARDKEGLAGREEDTLLLLSLVLDRGFAFHALGKHEAALSDLKYCLGLNAPRGHVHSARLDELNALLNRAKEERPVRDFYEVLGVERTASKADIKRAYRKLALMYHPDKNDTAEAAALFLELTEAFDVLFDDTTRARYDAGVGGAQLRKEAAQNQQQQRANFHFNFGEFTEDGRVKAWFTNAEGEQEWTEFETDQSRAKHAADEQEKQRKAAEEKKKEIPKHCCLPLGFGE